MDLPVKHIKKAIWWLSVDNYTLWATPKARKRYLGFFRAYFNPFFFYKVKKVLKNIDYHFYQSYYAYNFLVNKKKIDKKKLVPLSDYISDNFFEKKNKSIEKENIVAFFPKKGYEIVKILQKNSYDIQWVPIQNMTSAQVQDLLAKSKVYVDFGPFPGRDRVSREAVTNGCCLITGKFGASKFQEDLPIKEEYKFSKPLESINEILILIRSCFNNYEEKTQDFVKYREIIKREKTVFIEQVKQFFCE